MSTLTETIPQTRGIESPIISQSKGDFHSYPFPVEPWIELGRSTPHSMSRWNYFRRKYVLERILGCALLVFTTPLIGFLWCIVRLHSKGGGFFRQTRVGYRGKTFEIIKLRTMVIDAEADGKARWCVKGDPRITSLGRLLRKTHLDELPQLLNVARGEMTLVGPRPERPCFVSQLKKDIDGYERRLSVLPGITGLAQINLPPDETIDDVRRKQHLDLLYIKQTNLWLDIRMLLATSIRLFGVPGELVIRILRLRRTIPASLAGNPSTEKSGESASRRVDSKKTTSVVSANGLQLAALRFPEPSAIPILPIHVPNALTIDVEDYFQVTGFADRISTKDWDSIPCRVEANTDRLLELFNERKVRGTFFILGWVADRYPKLIRRIAEEGHELGCHSYWHRLVYRMTPEEFRLDLLQARAAIEQAARKEVSFYRAPSFSITQSSLWALDILSENGFKVDSSIFPMKHDRYGIPGAPSAIHRHQGVRRSIMEYPPTVWRAGPLKVPVGGGYFRLAPRRLTQIAIDGARRVGIPAMFYIHPWEIDPQQPRISGVRFLNRYRHYVGLRGTYSKLRWILERNRFSCISEVMSQFHLVDNSSTYSTSMELAENV